ncbi:hypothetical protein JXA47_05795 [Candidatus Sumerlaeota bacterium]|nr:hypothetical protein [Candidatus Sumerlaeota bacterium]
MMRGLTVMMLACALGACVSVPEIPEGWDFDHEDCWLREMSGYGVSLKGRNPSQAELFAEIRALSAEYRVPVEIIGAVMEQESLGFQYGGDRAIVHNRRECQGLYEGTRRESAGPPGLGLMQLTGATARAFNVPRLITDWRYNLRAGVETLVDKHRRFHRDDPPEMQEIHERNRDILENWHWAVLGYNGFVPNSAYPGRVYARMAAPSEQLKGLFTPVEITAPETVIPGFITAHTPVNHTLFAVEHDGTWLLEDGTIRAPFHVTESEWARGD